MMIKNYQPQSSTSTLLNAIDDVQLGIILVDESNRIIQWNSLASQWLGVDSLHNVELSDTWLTEKSIHLKDLNAQPLTALDLFKASATPIKVESQHQSIWLSAQCDATHWQGRPAHMLVFCNINKLASSFTQLQRQTNQASLRDPITGLSNRHNALERMEDMHKHGKRYGSQFTIALIDIDNFKRINDTYGQNFGDKVIARIALTLKGALRETDFCSRYGGEEFLVLMPETAMMDAVVTLDRLRQQVSELKWEECPSPITVSAGVHTWQRNSSIEQLLFETDQRLTMAKNAGRNQVCGDLV
ncbi:sensor domain-containing diguanylate cyclase [Reinekea forsetii]|nr:sensor domain-containing diguanylate cyclase [Reinekea forsetii]